MDPVLGRSGLGGVVENHPGAAVGAGDVDRRVPGDRAWADGAAGGVPPEVAQGDGIGGVDGEGCETQADGGGHDCFLPMDWFTGAALGVWHQRLWCVSEDGAVICPGGQVLVVSLVSGDASGEDSLAGNSGERPVVSCW